MMQTFDKNTRQACEDKIDVNKILEEYDAYIRYLAHKAISHTRISPEVLKLEVDELAQNTRIKLWLALQQKRIGNLCAYISSIVHNECIDMVRKYGRTIPLLINEDGEQYQGTLLISPGQGLQDPADEIERAEVLTEYMTRVVEDVFALPPRQRQAMICALKERVTDTQPLFEKFLEFGLDIRKVHWSREKLEEQRLRASLSIALKKLRAMRSRYNYIA
ncbi:MAG TPA: sigma factor [Ktedonosporobacter sp.]|nr:sigma factor [Ktedonosporobacter sp.]